MKKIILCGGSGYIGTKLTEHLLDNTNYEIVIVDRLDFKLENFTKSFLSLFNLSTTYDIKSSKNRHI